MFTTFLIGFAWLVLLSSETVAWEFEAIAKTAARALMETMAARVYEDFTGVIWVYDGVKL